MKDRQKAVQLTAKMLGFPAVPSKDRDDKSDDHSRDEAAVDNTLSSAVQELARQHPRVRAKGKS